MGFVVRRASAKRSRQWNDVCAPTMGSQRADGETVAAEFGLNWKGRAFEWVKRIVGAITFPDVRGEWEKPAWLRLESLLTELKPDLVVSSHEPATTLQLGLLAKACGYRWVADLGDPVLAPYTPKRWRKKSFELEAAVCARADRVVVTASGTKALLMQRHGLRSARCSVVTQGFDDTIRPSDVGRKETPREVIDILYTGSFYHFRRSDALVAAVLELPRVTLSIASPNPPSFLVEAASRNPERIRLLGFLTHSQVLELQRSSDILINIGNESSCQVPGKLYEYLGAGRPILHIRGGPNDAAEEVVRDARRGVFCDNDPSSIRQVLQELSVAAAQGRLDSIFDLSAARVARFGWSRLTASYEELLCDALAAA